MTSESLTVPDNSSLRLQVEKANEGVLGWGIVLLVGRAKVDHDGVCEEALEELLRHVVMIEDGDFQADVELVVLHDQGLAHTAAGARGLAAAAPRPTRCPPGPWH